MESFQALYFSKKAMTLRKAASPLKTAPIASSMLLLWLAQSTSPASIINQKPFLFADNIPSAACAMSASVGFSVTSAASYFSLVGLKLPSAVW